MLKIVNAALNSNTKAKAICPKAKVKSIKFGLETP